MTTVRIPHELFTLEEFVKLPEDNSRRYEVQEGVLIVSPRAAGNHQFVVKQLVRQLDDQLPREWVAMPDMEVVTHRDYPLGLRVPDVLVARTAEVSGKIVQVDARDVVLAIEVISPGSRRTDTVVKPLEYAEAGIPFYWVVDLEPPISLAAYHLAGELGAYQEAPAVTGEFVTQEPFPLRIDVPRLTERP
jgi:Uma2 family endonuclease